MTDETVKSVKVLKLYAWEESFGEKIEACRRHEVAQLTKYMILRAIMACMWTGLPIAVSISTFATYTLTGNELTAARAFTALALFGILRFPLTMFPWTVSRIVEAQVSIDRLEAFFAAHELQKQISPLPREFMGDEKEMGAVVLGIQGRFFWGPDLPRDHPFFQRIISSTDKKASEKQEEQKGEQQQQQHQTNGKGGEIARRHRTNSIQSPHILAIETSASVPLRIREGKLVIVVGRTGCGKSALLGALLGELEADTEALRTSPRGGVAYASQVPWICHASLRENIVFGSQFDQKWYEEVVDVCALGPDIELLPAGDKTEIGEQGVNLSGGQKQRVALARAVYANRDIYLLDDTLSAVDAQVGRHIFNKCILGVLSSKTVVLVTHNLRFLPAADQVILIEEGKIAYSGKYEGLASSSSSTSFAAYVSELRKREDTAPPTSPTNDEKNDNEKSKRSKGEHGNKGEQKEEGGEQQEEIVQKEGKEKTKSANIMRKEKREEGHVQWAVYVKYFMAAGGWGLVFAVVLAIILVTATDVYKDAWLTVWSRGSKGTTFYLSIYASIAIASVLLRGVFLGLAYKGGLNASGTGSVLNRFSHDVYTVDEQLPNTMANFCSTFFRVLGTIGTISYVTPLFLAALVIGDDKNKQIITFRNNPKERKKCYFLVPTTWLYWYAQRYYIATSRCLKRWDSTLRSPIYAHFGETVAGLETIRAFGSTGRFATENARRLRKSLSAYFPSIAANRWLAVRLEFVGTLIITFAALFAVLGRGSINAAFAALSISYALNVTQSLNWLVRMTSQRETSVVAVERIAEYIETPSEAPLVIPGRDPASTWPEKGKLEIKNYWLRYLSRLPWVLQGVDAVFHAGEKVGVVGRTGAGKSTLLLALLRLVEIPNTKEEEGGQKKTLAARSSDQKKEDQFISSRNSTTGSQSMAYKKYLRATKESIMEDGRQPLLNEKGEETTGWKDNYVPCIFWSSQLREMILMIMCIRSKTRDDIEHGSAVNNGAFVEAAAAAGLEEEKDGRALTRGKILIDGVDISSVGLKALRGAVAIIPQDPVLFSGTIRFNLDPFERHSRADIESVLKAAHLWEHVATLKGGINANVGGGGGSTFSVGQRQLLCLARALLRRTRILLLDEATSAIDHKTDQMVQETLRQEFKHATVITIAHRLDTILHSDKVLVMILEKVIVMDKGRVEEQGAPDQLLKDPSSLFSILCRKEKQ
eukprot:jgi/Bigna1/74416/fgenesh1_pg.29_\